MTEPSNVTANSAADTRRADRTLRLIWMLGALAFALLALYFCEPQP